MADGLIVAVGLVVVLIILPALFALVFERARSRGPHVEMILGVDKAEARATLRYYNEVHDSHSG